VRINGIPFHQIMIITSPQSPTVAHALLFAF
jgi:hypothetical protein